MERIIHLVRHLSTDGRPPSRIGRREHAAWLRSEGDHGIAPGAVVDPALSAAVATSSHIVVSPLSRARQTASAALATVAADRQPVVLIMDDLREAQLPVVALPGLRAPLDAWDTVCRVAWLSGYAGGVESRSAAGARAGRAAVDLDRLAAAGTVTVVGHGFFNILLARQLRRLGWCGPRLPNHAHGAVNRYVR